MTTLLREISDLLVYKKNLNRKWGDDFSEIDQYLRPLHPAYLCGSDLFMNLRFDDLLSDRVFHGIILRFHPKCYSSVLLNLFYWFLPLVLLGHDLGSLLSLLRKSALGRSRRSTPSVVVLLILWSLRIVFLNDGVTYHP